MCAAADCGGYPCPAESITETTSPALVIAADKNFVQSIIARQKKLLPSLQELRLRQSEKLLALNLRHHNCPATAATYSFRLALRAWSCDRSMD
jgi:hypothetical protein